MTVLLIQHVESMRQSKAGDSRLDQVICTRGIAEDIQASEPCTTRSSFSVPVSFQAGVEGPAPGEPRQNTRRHVRRG